MSAAAERSAVAPSVAPSTPAFAPLRPAYCLLVAPVAVALALAGLAVAASDEASALELVRPFVVALWAVAGLALGVRRRHDRLAPIVLAGAVVGGAGTLAAAMVEHRSLDGVVAVGWDLALRATAALLPAVAMHLLFGLADGRLATPIRRRAVATGYVAAAVVGVALMADRDRLVIWPVAVLWALALGFGIHASHVRYVKAGAVDRRRMQWIGWGMAVATEAAIVAVALRLLTDWPPNVWRRRPRPQRADPDRAHARHAAHDGRPRRPPADPHGRDRRADGGRRRHLRRGGDRPRPDAVRRRAGAAAAVDGGRRAVARCSTCRRDAGSPNGPTGSCTASASLPTSCCARSANASPVSIPMDELLLQLVESLRKAMVLVSAEVWTGQDGHFELAAGVPHRQAPPIVIGAKESAVVARAGVSGGTWLDIWVPAAGRPQRLGVDAARAGRPRRRAARVHRRSPAARDGEPFTEAEDRVLTELARQVALALHNVQLDTALQASLDELQVRNDELQQSRARIVAAGDAERRKLERNLHDGAQQHLVALAVKLRLTRDAVEDDPDDAIAMIDEIKGNLQDAIQELRALAHGIFPPLLVSGGLAEALPAAAARAALPTTVDTAGIGRYSAEVEAAVYFCVLEAMQNAGKHAGDDAIVARDGRRAATAR